MMGHKEKINEEEFDVFSRWRKVYCWKRGRIAKIKKCFHRRARRTYKVDVDKELALG
jgi:hypothetical protein